MELQFQKVGGRYEAEFEATGDFNLHCERKGAGNFKLYQKGTPEGQYATESSYADHNAEAVVDKDFSMLVYPKMGSLRFLSIRTQNTSELSVSYSSHAPR